MTQILLTEDACIGVFTVRNIRGIHTRPATEIVKCCSRFKADIKLSFRNYEINAKSILGVLLLAAGKGARIKIAAIGEDADLAVRALEQLASKQFYVVY